MHEPGAGVVFCHVGKSGQSGVDAIDLDGAYATYFVQGAIEMLVVRPDFYIFAACVLAQLPSVINDLLLQLRRLISDFPQSM